MFLQLEMLEIKNDDDRIASYLLKAHLASLVDGINFSHVHRSSGKTLRRKLGSRLRALGYLDKRLVRTAVPLGGQAAWSVFADAVGLAGIELHRPSGLPRKLADRRNPNLPFGALPLVNVGALNWLSHLVRLGAPLTRHSDLQFIEDCDIADNAHDRVWLSRCVHCINVALSEGLISPDEYLKGSSKAVAWLAPLVDRVAVLARTRSAGDMPQAATNEIRDLLGLWNEDGVVLRPLVLFRLRPGASLHAPHVLTADCYARFRHRPKRFVASAPEAGLTYNLDPSAPSPGACEVVAVGIGWKNVLDVTSCGLPSKLAASTKELVAMHRRFTQSVCRRRSFRTILQSLEEVLS